MLADDLHRRLVGADGAVGAEAEERPPAPRRPGAGSRKSPSTARLRWVTSSWMPTVKCRFGRVDAASSSNTGFTIGRRELLGGQPVAAADHPGRPANGRRRRRPWPRSARPGREGRAARRPRPAPWCGRARRWSARSGGSAATSAVDGERAGTAGPAAARRARRRRRGPRPSPAAAPAAEPMTHDHPVGVGRAVVLDQPVAPAGAGRRARPSRPRHDAGHGVVERVGRLPGLEEDVGVLRRAPHHRARRASGPRPGRRRRRPRRTRAREVVVVEERDLVDLVGGAEPVEEVQERHPRPQRGGVGDEGEVVRLLHRRRRPASPSPVARACITSLWSPKIDRAWVAMVRAATWITAGVSSPAILNMLGIISSRPCDAVNVVASAPFCSAPCSAPAAPASDCISTTSGTDAPQVGPAGGRPSRRQCSAHRRRRRDRVDGDDLAEGVGDPGRRLVAVDAGPAGTTEPGRLGRGRFHSGHEASGASGRGRAVPSLHQHLGPPSRRAGAKVPSAAA